MGKIAARPGRPYTRRLCSLHRCTALLSRRWPWLFSRRPFIAALAIIRREASRYASTIRPHSSIHPLLFSSASDFFSGPIASSGTRMPAVCSSWRKICVIAKTNFRIPHNLCMAASCSLVRCFRCKSTGAGPGNRAALVSRRRTRLLQLHFYYPRSHAADGWRCARHSAPHVPA